MSRTATLLDSKKCRKCGRLLPIGEFNWHRRYGRELREARCRACIKEYYAQRKLSNPERAAMERQRKNKQASQWAALHPERTRQRQRGHYERHGDEVRARTKAWRLAHPAQYALDRKRWRAGNMDTIRAQAQRWKEGHPSQHRAAQHLGRAKRRQREMSVIRERVDPLDVFERD